MHINWKTTAGLMIEPFDYTFYLRRSVASPGWFSSVLWDRSVDLPVWYKQ